ncbi:MAG: transglycosylase SLT domain-containing protein [Candidatus Eisenbacteria bacterium]|nr:transglycosylase SLT domain-containing protein [Candidatus Eisenbacteria bacterium]
MADSVSQLDALTLILQRDGAFARLSAASHERTRLTAETRELVLGLMEGFEPGLGPYAEELAPCLVGGFAENREDRELTLKRLLPFVESLEESAGGFETWALAAGIVLTKDGKHALASRYFERAARPGFHLAPHATYLALERCGASGEAERMLSLEKRLEPEEAEPGPSAAAAAPSHILRLARVTTGVTLAGSRLREEGRVMLEDLMKEDLSSGDEVRVGLALGRYYRNKGEYDRAARFLAETFRGGGSVPEARAACDEYASLVARGQTGLELSETLGLAGCLARGGREAEAARILESAVRSNPRSTAAVWELARLRYRMGQYDKAAGLFQKLERMERSKHQSWRARLWFARCRRQAGKAEVSVRIMRELAREADGAVGMEAAWEVGFDLESLGRLDEAASEYASLNRRYPASRLGQESLWRKGFCEFRRGRYAEARSLFAVVRKSTSLPDLRDSAAFWVLKCDLAAGKPVTVETVRAETAGRGPDPGGLYGALLLSLTRSEGLDTVLLVRPWADVGEGSGSYGGRVSTHSDSADVLIDLPQEFRNGAVLLRLGLADLAKVEFSVCERRLSGNAEALALLAQLYWRNGLYRRGVLTAERALATSGNRGLTVRTEEFLRKMTYPVCFAGAVYEHSRSQGVDPFLVLSVMKRESAFDPAAVSRAGAVGLMQLMPGTARSVAAYLGEEEEDIDLTDPEVNLKYGIWHLGRLVGRYSDSVVAALAAYNAGEGNAERWLSAARQGGGGPARGGADGFVYMESVSYRETRDYIHRVLADLLAYRSLY